MSATLKRKGNLKIIKLRKQLISHEKSTHGFLRKASNSPSFYQALPALVWDVHCVIGSNGIFNISRLSLMFGNFLGVFLVTRCVFAVHDGLAPLVNSPGVLRIALIKLGNNLPIQDGRARRTSSSAPLPTIFLPTFTK